MRLPLEAMALNLAKPKMAETDFAKLEDLKARMVSEFRDDSLRLCAQLDMRFHALIWERAGNSRLSATLRTLLAPFFAYGSLFAAHRRPDLTAQLIADEHDLMIHFLNGRAECTAEDCLRFHLGL